jgi:hypothetical protein
MSRNIRIRTEPNGGDKHIKVQLNQDFDFLEILSLKISQEDAYRAFYSDYGVVVGRIIMNSGVGIPNAKISIFIPLTEDDAQDEEISSIYPYSDISIVNSEGVRYNLLPKDSQSECHTPVGTFPSKKDLLDNKQLMSIYDKYYKYTTTTNDSGDYMLFGVPVGNHVLNVDVDLSDIGIYSQRPYDFIEQGNPNKLFDSPTKFKKSVTLNSLTQLKNSQIGINVIPFWGEDVNDEIGITRNDVDLNYELVPKAIFIGSIFGDNEKNSLNKNCRPRKKLGKVCEMSEGGGTIEMLRKTIFGENERFDIEGGRVIDDNGAWAYQIPMNLDYMVTNEYGDLIPTDDTTRGIPTRAKMRFKISTDETGGDGRLRTKAKHLIPHNPKNYTEIDYTFDESTPEIHFRDFYWNKIYTIKNFVSRFQRNNNVENRNFIGFKDVDDCVGTKNPLPFNTMDSDFNPLYSIISIITIINQIVGFKFLGITPFCRFGCITIPCNGINYKPGCKNCGGSGNSSVSQVKECIELTLAEALNVFEFDFYNEWVNGSLYSFLLKYKKKKSDEKFCGDEDGSYYLINTNAKGKTIKDGQQLAINNGPVISFKGELFYRPMTTNSALLYASDTYSLGSVFDCDWQGISNIHNQIIPTTYHVPDIVQDGDVSEATITSLLLDINCSGVKAGVRESTNIGRLCEIGIGLDDDLSGTINDADISNEILRRNLISLNDTNYSGVPISDLNSGFESASYSSYRGLRNINGLDQAFGNSFFFYFGTVPNKTAIELMNSKYFTVCTKQTKNLITIISNIQDVLIINGATGSIGITINGGAPTVVGTTTGYDIQWSNGEVDTLNIVGLTEGTYSVVVTDGNGKISKKTFIVRGIKPIEFTTRTKNTQTNTSNNGVIYIDSIIGGIGPYDLIITGPSSIYTFNDIPYSTVLTGVGVGTYNIKVVDSSPIPLEKILSVSIVVPQTLTIVNLVTKNLTCFESDNGVISFDIQGGTIDYTINLSGVLTNGGTYLSTTNDNNNLLTGTYNLTISDAYGQTYTNPPILITGPIGQLVLSKTVGNPFYLNNTVIGVSYKLFLDGNVINTVIATSTVTNLNNVTTSTGTYIAANDFNCESNTVII